MRTPGNGYSQQNRRIFTWSAQAPDLSRTILQACGSQQPACALHGLHGCQAALRHACAARRESRRLPQGCKTSILEQAPGLSDGLGVAEAGCEAPILSSCEAVT